MQICVQRLDLEACRFQLLDLYSCVIPTPWCVFMCDSNSLIWIHARPKCLIWIPPHLSLNANILLDLHLPYTPLLYIPLAWSKKALRTTADCESIFPSKIPVPAKRCCLATLAVSCSAAIISPRLHSVLITWFHCLLPTWCLPDFCGFGFSSHQASAFDVKGSKGAEVEDSWALHP